MPPNKRLKLAGRPQLKRDPLGGPKEFAMTFRAIVYLVGLGVALAFLIRRALSAQSRSRVNDGSVRRGGIPKLGWWR